MHGEKLKIPKYYKGIHIDISLVDIAKIIG